MTEVLFKNGGVPERARNIENFIVNYRVKYGNLFHLDFTRPIVYSSSLLLSYFVYNKLNPRFICDTISLFGICVTHRLDKNNIHNSTLILKKREV